MEFSRLEIRILKQHKFNAMSVSTLSKTVRSTYIIPEWLVSIYNLYFCTLQHLIIFLIFLNAKP